MTACQGGWCTRRDRCANYHAVDRRHPVDRLCGDDFESFRLVTPADAEQPEEAPWPTEWTVQ